MRQLLRPSDSDPDADTEADPGGRADPPRTTRRPVGCPRCGRPAVLSLTEDRGRRSEHHRITLLCAEGHSVPDEGTLLRLWAQSYL